MLREDGWMIKALPKSSKPFMQVIVMATVILSFGVNAHAAPKASPAATQRGPGGGKDRCRGAFTFHPKHLGYAAAPGPRPFGPDVYTRRWKSTREP